MVTVSWITSLLVMRHGVTTVSQNQNSPRSGDMWIPHQTTSSKTQPSAGKVMCVVFWDRKEVILLDFLELEQTINSECYTAMLTKLKAQTYGVRLEKKTTLLLQHNIARPHTSVWRLWSRLPMLAGLSYHTHHIVQMWGLLTSICMGQWKMNCMSNSFLATMPLYQLWNTGSLPLVKIFMSRICRLLLIAGENS